MEIKETGEYGLKNYEFKDLEDKRSIISEYGCNKEEIKIGLWSNYMRLNKEQVKILLPILSEFIKNGQF